MPPAFAETKTSTCGQEGPASVASFGLQMCRTWKRVSVQRQTGERVDETDKSHAICRGCADGCGWDILVVQCVCIRDQDVLGSAPWSPWEQRRSEMLCHANEPLHPPRPKCAHQPAVLKLRCVPSPTLRCSPLTFSPSFFLNTSSSFCWRHTDGKLPITNRKLSLRVCACVFFGEQMKTLHCYYTLLTLRPWKVKTLKFFLTKPLGSEKHN